MDTVTMADIAKQCGVSKRTVSAVINFKPGSGGRVGEKTAQKVRAAAEELGYKPNRTARHFLQRRHGAIGILMRWIEDIPHEVLGQLILQAREHDLVVLVEEYRDMDGEMPNLIREDCVDGLVVVSQAPESLTSEIEKISIPVLGLNTGEWSFGPSVNFDERYGAKTIIERFAELKRQRPMLVLPPEGSEHYSVRERTKWLRHYAEEAGMGPLVVTHVGGPPWDPPQADALRQNKDVDCVVLYTDRMAPSFCRVVRRMGLDVPDHFSAVCYNNTLAAMATYPSMTAMGIPPVSIAKSVLDMLAGSINGENNTSEDDLKYMMYERDSTAEPGMRADAYYAFEEEETQK